MNPLPVFIGAINHRFAMDLCHNAKLQFHQFRYLFDESALRGHPGPTVYLHNSLFQQPDVFTRRNRARRINQLLGSINYTPIALAARPPSFPKPNPQEILDEYRIWLDYHLDHNQPDQAALCRLLIAGHEHP